jgi:hypothetical protein
VWLANGLGGLVLVLLVMDPTRPLAPIILLLAAAVVVLYADKDVRVDRAANQSTVRSGVEGET